MDGYMPNTGFVAHSLFYGVVCGKREIPSRSHGHICLTRPSTLVRSNICTILMVACMGSIAVGLT